MLPRALKTCMSMPYFTLCTEPSANTMLQPAGCAAPSAGRRGAHRVAVAALEGAGVVAAVAAGVLVGRHELLAHHGGQRVAVADAGEGVLVLLVAPVAAGDDAVAAAVLPVVVARLAAEVALDARPAVD